jgi:hypothetical protein
VAAWYTAGGWKPFGATTEQLANIRALEHQLAVADSNKLAAADAVAAAPRSVAVARIKAARANKLADAEVAAKTAARNRAAAAAGAKPVIPDALSGARNQVVPAARPKAATAKRPTGPGIAAAKAAVRNRGVTNPTATRDDEARAAADLELAQAAAAAVQLEGEAEIQAALDAQKAAERHATLTDETASRIAADLEMARQTAGVQVPADEIVFLPALPVRVEQVKTAIGDAASGPVMTVTNNQLAIDSSLPLEEARLVQQGMAVAIDEPALGVKATGVVQRVADTPGTDGVDGYHIYLEVRVEETATPLAGFSLRLTIPIGSTHGAVTAVPISALSLSPDGTSRVQVENDGALEFIVVEPGLSADGFVELTRIHGELAPGQLVVVGYEKKY